MQVLSKLSNGGQRQLVQDGDHDSAISLCASVPRPRTCEGMVSSVEALVSEMFHETLRGRYRRISSVFLSVLS